MDRTREEDKRTQESKAILPLHGFLLRQFLALARARDCTARLHLLGHDLPGSGEDGWLLLGDWNKVAEDVKNIALSAGSLGDVAHWVVVWAAVDVVRAASGLWKWAASPLEALSEDLLLAAAGVSGGAAVRGRALVRWWWRW